MYTRNALRIFVAGLFMAFIGWSIMNLAWLLPVRDDPIPPQNEVVMQPAMVIEGNTPAGKLSILAGQGLKRTYTWEGESRSVQMRPRLKSELRDMGIYFPGAGEHWYPNHGITRGVLQEGVIHFKSDDEMFAWLKETPGFVPRVYRNDGLSLWVMKNSSRKQLNVDLFQIDVNGKRPSSLPGADDSSITVLPMHRDANHKN
jgi:hypothetical protein